MDLKNRKVLVFGSGKSGIAAAMLLEKKGAKPVIYDGNDRLNEEDIRSNLKNKGCIDAADVKIVLGEFPDELYDEIDMAVLSPGIPCDLPVVEKIREKKTEIIGEIELAYMTGKGKVLAITGTNGKTTSTTLLGEIMKAACKEVYVVGNIGNPYTEVSYMQTENAVTVAEISSFQLETIKSFHPYASAITNITPDHLNRHHTMEEYIRVKERIAENQTPDEICVLNYEDEVLREFGKTLKCRPVYFSSARPVENGMYYKDGAIYIAEDNKAELFVRTDELHLLGLHNFENIMTAALMALFEGVDIDTVRNVTKAFKGVAHRIEFVCEKDGVRYYNDSKGTNPDAAIKGIQAMNRPTLLIGGGYDKQSTYEEWINSFDNKVKKLVLIGQTKDKIADAAEKCGFPREDIVKCEDLAEAVAFCKKEAKSGEAVLLSPACASWGQFDNYEQRGDMFKKLAFEG